ncbi:SusD/RagB family nutrient-binding outer membrane lipoprotein [Larkinella bovis]|uniref:SusD/RagB family nutrient-binding outer membrane lipoprotein n=1 Tax=Larkinella bovis TaxID=683041 RepID=A0ABW0IAA2_9BACT
MKTLFSIIVTGSVLLLSACDSGFEELNKDPNAVTADRFNPVYLFTTGQYNTAKGDESNTLNYAEPFVQHMASLSNVGIFDFQGDKYVYHKGNNENLWKATYNAVAGSSKLIEDVIALSKDKPQYHNLYHMARIWKTVIYHRLTDMYGDVPYSEANQGYYKQIYKPKYDAQKDIYAHMLAELEDATAKLDAKQTLVGTADIIYQGDILKWKRFGYSMMLRLGMRLSKVDPAAAESWVKKAVAGGVFTSISDNVFIKGTDKAGTQEILTNGQSWILSVSGRSPGKISKTFFDYMKSHNDPRLKHTVAVYTDPTNVATKNTDPAVQKGMPNGLDRITLPGNPSYDPKAPGQEHQFSGVNRDVFAKLDGPRMFITYAEVQLMLAEAAVRGWVTGDAAQFYQNGVTGAMKMLQQYDASATISDAEIAAYLAANPFAGAANREKALEQINSEYWVATFLNGYEAYANVRRSGYPKLVPVNYPDNETGGTYPRRLRYPDDEPVLNADNYNASVARQGPDNYKTRVWWDKP